MRKKLLLSRSGFEKPESREEAIMQNILGASNVLEPSESNIEEILKSILYNTPYTKEAEFEIEKILLAIKNNSTYDGEGESRDMKILIAILKDLDYTEEAESRIEELLIEWLYQRSSIKVIEGVPPLSFTAKGKPLTAWSITGNTVQNGTPTPENPVEVQSVGDYDSETGLYRIPIVTSADGAEPITTPIYLSEPLQAGEVLRSDGSREVKWSVKVFDGSENWIYGDENSYGIVYFYLNLISHKYDNAEFTDIKCTHLPESKLYFSDSKSECCALWTGPTGLVVYLRLKKTNMATVDDLKLWLSAQYAAGTPVTILYSLAEPTTETIAVPQIPTFGGTTVIDVDTAVKPSNVYIEYK